MHRAGQGTARARACASQGQSPRPLEGSEVNSGPPEHSWPTMG
jgi:hypothetical protein